MLFSTKNGPIIPLDQNPYQPVTCFVCLGFQCMRAGFLCPNCDNIGCLHTRQDQNEFYLKRWFFLPKSSSSISLSQAHLAKRKRVGWSIGFNSWTNWSLYGVIQNSSQWCFRNVQLLRTTVNWYWCRFTHTIVHSSNILGWGCQFLLLISQDNENTELMVFFFFQNPYTIFAHILQYYHDFESNVVIFLSDVEAYIQTYSSGGRIKLIICQIRHELSITIHEISASWKNVRWRTQYNIASLNINLTLKVTDRTIVLLA